jgi:hypothetical protein
LALDDRKNDSHRADVKIILKRGDQASSATSVLLNSIKISSPTIARLAREDAWQWQCPQTAKLFRKTTRGRRSLPIRLSPPLAPGQRRCSLFQLS